MEHRLLAIIIIVQWDIISDCVNFEWMAKENYWNAKTSGKHFAFYISIVTVLLYFKSF